MPFFVASGACLHHKGWYVIYFSKFSWSKSTGKTPKTSREICKRFGEEILPYLLHMQLCEGVKTGAITTLQKWWNEQNDENHYFWEK